jgi:hypothetical protein
MEFAEGDEKELRQELGTSINVPVQLGVMILNSLVRLLLKLWLRECLSP